MLRIKDLFTPLDMYYTYILQSKNNKAFVYPVANWYGVCPPLEGRAACLSVYPPTESLWKDDLIK